MRNTEGDKLDYDARSRVGAWRDVSKQCVRALRKQVRRGRQAH